MSEETNVGCCLLGLYAGCYLVLVALGLVVVVWVCWLLTVGWR